MGKIIICVFQFSTFFHKITQVMGKIIIRVFKFPHSTRIMELLHLLTFKTPILILKKNIIIYV
jgi:hypothetical protein